ncbi:MAG: hypothetical protein IPL52_09595 [Flavobacteriales bacterium]|nr:hypothetical protein [Flavobacteriales bacterium]
MRCLFLLLLLPQIGQAQLLDSIGLFLQEPPRPLVKLDMRGSFVSNSSVRFMGVKAGVQHAGRFQYGLGYQFLFTPVEQEIIVDGTPTIAHLRLGYLAPYAEYAFYQRGPWEVRIPVQIGIGGGSVVYKDADGRRQRYARSGLFLYEPAMVVQYRFFKYAGLAAGWGYRLVLHTRNDLGETLTAPIYIIGLRIFFVDIVRGSRTGAE